MVAGNNKESKIQVRLRVQALAHEAVLTCCCQLCADSRGIRSASINQNTHFEDNSHALAATA
jgi:sulfur relay (sulfurtransferase) complex TusBCD TusD component (DsrE family)